MTAYPSEGVGVDTPCRFTFPRLPRNIELEDYFYLYPELSLCYFKEAKK